MWDEILGSIRGEVNTKKLRVPCSWSPSHTFFCSRNLEKNGLGTVILKLSIGVLLHFAEPQTKRPNKKNVFFRKIGTKARGSQFRVYLSGVQSYLWAFCSILLNPRPNDPTKNKDDRVDLGSSTCASRTAPARGGDFHKPRGRSGTR